MKVDDETWAEIRRLYVETNEAIRQIGARFKVAHSTISQRALKERWPARPPRGVRTIPLPPPAEGETPPAAGAQVPTSKKRKRRKPLTPEARSQRLLTIMDLQLEQLEKDMALADKLSVQDRERLGRQFAVIVANLAKVKEEGAAHEKAKASSAGAGARPSSGEFRRQIAERLERLNAKWMAGKKSGKACRQRD